MNLNKQTIQKLDSQKLANVYAGEAAAEQITSTLVLTASALAVITGVGVAETGSITLTAGAACIGVAAS